MGYVKFCAEFFLCDKDPSIVQFLEQGSEEEKMVFEVGAMRREHGDFVKFLNKSIGIRACWGSRKFLRRL